MATSCNFASLDEDKSDKERFYTIVKGEAGELGKGAFSKVYKYTLKPSYHQLQIGNQSMPKNVAIKMIEIYGHGSDELSNEINREVKITMDLTSGQGHKNIVMCFGSKVSPNNTLNILMELCDGTMQDLVEAKRMLPLGSVSQLFVQVFEGLAYIHDKKIIHRDVKPSNILLLKDPQDAEVGWEEVPVENLTVKLGDFGSSRVFESDEKRRTMTLRGTLYFMPPEIRKDYEHFKSTSHYSTTADIYSATLCALIAFTKGPDLSTYHNDSSQESLARLTQLPDGDAFNRFLWKGLGLIPCSRPSASEMLRDFTFFREGYPNLQEAKRTFTGSVNTRRGQVQRTSSWPSCSRIPSSL